MQDEFRQRRNVAIMANEEQGFKVYQSLAEAYERSGETQLRDRFLVLAADAALNSGNSALAEELHTRLLQRNPGHLLKPFASFAEAMKSRDVLQYVNALRRSNPVSKAEQLLGSLVMRSPMPEPPPFGPAPVAPEATLPLTVASPPMVPEPKPKPSRDFRLFSPPAPEPTQAPEPPARSRPAPSSVPPAQVPVRLPAHDFPPEPVRAEPMPPPLPEPAPMAPMAPLSFPDLPPPRQPAAPLAMEPLPAFAPRPVHMRASASEADIFHPPRQEYQPPRQSWVPNRPSMPWQEPVPASGAWVSTLLCGFVLMLSVFLALYTLGKPFMPQGWISW